jgi:hypothetical protein
MGAVSRLSPLAPIVLSLRMIPKASGKLCKLCHTEVTDMVIGSEDKMAARNSEQTPDLGIYLQKFGQQPKLQSYLSYRVLRKECT